MSKKSKHTSLFNLEGRFLGFMMEDGYKIKRLRLATADGELCIKLSKESRVSVGGVLTPGDWLQIWGEKTVKSEYEVKLKAYRIRVIAPNQPLLRQEASPFQEKASKPKASVLVCQKSDCARRGAKGICKALENALSDRGLTDEVTIRGTGCMKHCKAGPNIVFMPDKTRYSRVCAEDISDLIDQHFPAQANSTPNTQESAEEETKRNTPVTIA